MKIERPWLVALRWLVLFAAATWVFSFTHTSLRVSHGVIVYLLLVIGANTTAGGWLGLVMVAGGYLAVDWFFVPPIGAFGTARNLDGVILAGFAATGLAVSALFTSFRRASERAEHRAAEIERLAEDRRRMSEEIARAATRSEAEQVRTALLRSIAHDLRTPLSAIRLAADRAGGPASESIREQTDLLTGYVDAVHEFGRVGTTAALRKDANVVEDLVGAAIRTAEAALQGRKLSVRTPPGGEIVIGDFDFALALRALVNLLENAGRYAPPDSEIEMTLSRRDRMVRIEVSDRGPGLAPDEAGRVFDPFQRGRASAGTKGSGLGLAIAQTFARAQGGEVIYAPRDGGGSTFVLELPLRIAP